MRGDLDGILAEKGAEALLLYSESFRNANMYYLTKFLAPDPFIFFKKVDANPVIVVNQMEYPRAQKQSIVKDVRSYFDYKYLEVVKTAKEPRLGTMKFIANVAKKELGAGTRICVPHNFPAMVADVLREEGLTIEPILDIVEKARETKDADEIGEIKAVQAVAEEAMAEAIDLIADAHVDANGTLIVEKEPLTVGKVKSFLGHKFLDHGCVIEEDIIVACGPKGSDPHYFGDPQDELKANQPIILDIYPRNVQKRYWTDITRTVVKGKASDKVKKMFDAVLEAKNASIDAIQAGALGSDIYDVCCNVLEKAGYETIRGGKQIRRGFTHSLGHGVGLDLHEGPSVSELYKFSLKEHSTITIEPGLYDPDMGGVRIEDIVEVTKAGCSNLTKMEICLEV
ncbi:MAG: M24 family metallopeptidase [Candidatus Bathyarchaeia archaeon]